MKALRRAVIAAAVAAAGGFAVLAATATYYGGFDGQGCGHCHEIRPMVDTWAASGHRGVACKECHLSSLSADLRMHVKNMRRVWLHARGEVPEQIHVRHPEVAPLIERCRACHGQEYADWKSGPHGASYATIFLDETHNRGRQLMDDCLRCHGMHFEGGIARLVEPIDRKGPWRFADATMADAPAIPCLTCHSLHRPGRPLGPRSERTAGPGVEQEVARPSLALYDRRALEHVHVSDLPLPAMREGSRAVDTSPDRRQALCYQCHAPRAERQVASGDDRTPVGVHEGLSCLACHQKHGETTRASCAGCHPRLSNCGIDVETMDTTFRSRDSRHNVHRVSCVACHPGGPPKRKPATAGARRESALRP